MQIRKNKEEKKSITENFSLKNCPTDDILVCSLLALSPYFRDEEMDIMLVMVKKKTKYDGSSTLPFFSDSLLTEVLKSNIIGIYQK